MGQKEIVLPRNVPPENFSHVLPAVRRKKHPKKLVYLLLGLSLSFTILAILLMCLTFSLKSREEFSESNIHSCKSENCEDDVDSKAVCGSDGILVGYIYNP